METILQTLNLNAEEIVRILVIGTMILVGFVALKIIFKLAMSVIKIGCGVTIAIVIGLFVLNMLS